MIKKSATFNQENKIGFKSQDYKATAMRQTFNH